MQDAEGTYEAFHYHVTQAGAIFYFWAEDR